MLITHLPSQEPQSRERIGGKASSIHRMQQLGIPVPPAFVVGTEMCSRYFDNHRQLPANLIDRLPDAIGRLERSSGKTFGTGPSPLLLSVRSGAAVSMPGMMDTILNLGINDEVERALAGRRAPQFARDTHARFKEQFIHTVGHSPSASPWQQLFEAIAAVFESWHSPRAITYRRDRGLPSAGGTAVTVQAMVFGNIDTRSGTGVLFTRDPSTGAPHPYGEWLSQAQGEDVVSGRRTPDSLDALARVLPEVHRDLLRWAAILERDAGDVQDIEFTVEAGTLWLLQTRSAKRTPQAAVKIAVALHREGLTDVSQSLDRITAEQVEAAAPLQVAADSVQAATLLARGRSACAGVVAGIIVTNIDEAERRSDRGESIILARPTTDPDDVHVMSLVSGVLTELGGSTSHAAVVCREFGVPCIVDCGAGNLMKCDGLEATMNATSGEVFAGLQSIHAAASEHDEDLRILADWARGETEHLPSASLGDMLRARQVRPRLSEN